LQCCTIITRRQRAGIRVKSRNQAASILSGIKQNVNTFAVFVAQDAKLNFVNRLKSIQDGDGTLLDYSMIVYGSSLSDGNVHSHRNLPTVVLGRGNGQLTTGRHVVYPDTPMTNLYLTLLDRMGVPAEKLGDSNGKVEHLSDV
jgi:hypothetical protein